MQTPYVAGSFSVTSNVETAYHADVDSTCSLRALHVMSQAMPMPDQAAPHSKICTAAIEQVHLPIEL